MGIVIDVNSGWLVLETTTSALAQEVRRRLTQIIPRNSISSYRGLFAIPKDSAHLLTDGFCGSDVIWTAAAKSLRDRQADEIHQNDVAKLKIASAVLNSRHFLQGYKLIDKLDDHQIDAVAAISANSVGGLALFDEQGLGKSISALCAFDRLRQMNQIDRLLIIAPKSVLSAWIDDADRMFQHTYVIRVVAGSITTRRRCIREHFDILVCNYESVISELHLLIRTITKTKARMLLVIDESYFVKNPAARRSKAIKALRPFCQQILILCGTPAPNSPRDLFNQIDLVSNRTISSESGTEHSDQKIAAQKALTTVPYLRRLKQDVWPNLPGKRLEKVFFDLSPCQRALYLKALDQLVTDVGNVDDATFKRRLRGFLARRSALLQICSHPGALYSSYGELPAKLLALDQLLYDLVERKRNKVVIWSFFRHSLRAIAERYQRYGLVRIDGSVTRLEDRSDAIRRFQADQDVKLFLGNPAAAGAGITLTAAHDAIYESFSNQASHYMQSLDRIHRRGQKSISTYYVLLASNTIEEHDFDRVRRKQRDGSDLLGDRYEPVITRERFLRELGSSKG